MLSVKKRHKTRSTVSVYGTLINNAKSHIAFQVIRKSLILP